MNLEKYLKYLNSLNCMYKNINFYCKGILSHLIKKRVVTALTAVNISVNNAFEFTSIFQKVNIF